MESLIDFPLGERSGLLPGAVGTLEVLTSTPATPANVLAIICHPHPVYGGTMHNKVIYTLARAFKDLGLRTVRFNFRGVGRSEGSYDEGRGEIADLMTIIRWAQQVRPQDKLWLAGFSFGSYIAAQAAQQAPVAQLVSIAPPINHFPFINAEQLTCPWLIVQGEEDEVVPPAAVFAWVEQLPNQPQLIRVPAASHFFHSQLLVLRDHLVHTLQARIAL